MLLIYHISVLSVLDLPPDTAYGNHEGGVSLTEIHHDDQRNSDVPEPQQAKSAAKANVKYIGF